MDLQGLWPILAAFAAVASLVWIAAGLSAPAGARAAPLARAMVLPAVLLEGCGLWWPGQLWPGDFNPVFGLLAALLLGAVGLAAAHALHRRQALRAIALLPLLLLAAYAFAMLGAPGLFLLARASGFGIGPVLVLLAVALLGLHLASHDSAWSRGLRAASSLVAAGLMAAAALAEDHSGAAPVVPLTAWIVAGALIAVAAMLQWVWHQAPVAGSGHQAPRIRAATIDSLTGLPTRLQFEQALALAAARCEARKRQLAVFVIDLDGFKPVNDSVGHAGGDRVLVQVGQRLKAVAHSGDMVARVGGDEFLLLTRAAASPAAAAELARRLIEAIGRPCQIDGRELVLSCSIGVALYPQDCTPDKLIARADAAMHSAKRAGGSRHCVYSPEMDADVAHDFEILRDLRQALANNELELYYQPKIDARSGQVTAAEALLRWQHPRRGMVLPDQFIPMAERSGLIGPLGNWVIEAACAQARAWRDKGLRMRVAINLSVYQMRQDDIADRIADALARHRIHPSLLTCEITESAAMEDTLATQETFRRLGELGVHLSIDDFGTGYSSLGYLRRLPAEELKIDRSFVMDLDSSADARAVVDAVVRLAHALGLKVVAEGVENQRQQQILTELGCDELQGFLFAKPMTARALLLWALDDRGSAAEFRKSLFGETRHATLPVEKISV